METNKNRASETFQDDLKKLVTKYYSNAISENVRRAFELKRKRGELIGRAPFGYINTRMNEADYKGKKIILDTEQSHLVKRMFELCLFSIDPIAAIKKEMPEMRADNPNGALLSRSQIMRVLTNPFYCGIIASEAHGSYEHCYDRIISKELLDTCQEVLLSSSALLPCKSVSSILMELTDDEENEK